MPQIPNPHLMPPGGWHLPVPGGLPAVTGASYRDLCDHVAAYRKNNRLPAGDPAQEIADYVCNTWPHFCVTTDEIPAEHVYRSCKSCSK